MLMEDSSLGFPAASAFLLPSSSSGIALDVLFFPLHRCLFVGFCHYRFRMLKWHTTACLFVG
jgi:hypothetical protein